MDLANHENIRFLADNTVGRLARWMRLLGYDVEISDRSARELAENRRQFQSGRILLGRCRGRSGAPAPAPHEHFVHVESEKLGEQIRQITEQFPLDFSKTFLTRCPHCNAPLSEPAALEALPEEMRDKVPPRVRKWRDRYRCCRLCEKVYWEGTHAQRMREYLKANLPEGSI
ncbi:MAG: Mut7-C RNAse domain-containing protein [Candidatus Sumerlaeota bacterium]